MITFAMCNTGSSVSTPVLNKGVKEDLLPGGKSGQSDSKKAVTQKGP